MIDSELGVDMKLAVIVVSLCMFPSLGIAQQASQTNKVVKGKITDIKQDRRSTTLIVTDGDEVTHEVKLTGLVKFEARAPGDKEFIRPGVYIGGEGVMSNNAIFIKKVSVLILRKGQRPPAGMVRKSEPESGKSQNAFDVRGLIKAVRPNPEFEDYLQVGLNLAGRIPMINLEPDYQVTVVHTDPGVAEVGMNAELTGAESKGSFKINKVVVTPKAPFRSEDVLTPAKKR